MRGDLATAVCDRRAAEGLDLRLLRPATLAGSFDPAALLRGDEVDEPPYWMHLWPGASALASVLAVAAEVRAGCRFIELGCGLGLPSLAAARRGATVLATDWKREPLPWVRASAAMSALRLDAMQMSWRDLALRPVFDVCAGADVAYDTEAEPMLVAALGSLLRGGGVAWLSDSVNIHRDTISMRLEAAGFAVRSTQRREEEEGRAVWVRIIEARRRT